MQKFEELNWGAKPEEPFASQSSFAPSVPSRSESIDSSIVRPKAKKSLFGKFMTSRRDSSADFEKPPRKTPSRASESSKSWSTADHNPIFRGTAQILSAGHSAIQSISQVDTRMQSFNRIPNTPAKPRKSDTDSQGPKLSSAPQSPLNTGSANYQDLMNDIRLELNEYGDKLERSRANSISKGAAPSMAPFALPPNLTGAGDFLPGTMTPAVGSTVNVADPAAGWTAPESWNILPDSVPTWPSAYDNSSAITRSASKLGAKIKRCFVRVFRQDGTFGTISCDIDTTVAELIQLLGKKFFLPSVSEYQLTVRTAGLPRILLAKERPLVYQRVLLEFMGYTEEDRLHDVGREDLSYICRFEFNKHSMRSFSEQEKEIMSRDFSHADLHRMDLETIPIIFYSHCWEIEHLNVSENPSVTIPSDFLQNCTNLKTIRYSSNKALQFPLNLLHARNLRHLDLSSNLLSHLDSIDFSKLASLESLDLHGNRLSKVNDSLSKLTNLQTLNISSNVLTELSESICKISSLKQLDISFNKVITLPDEIGLLTNLEELAISNNYLTKRLPDTIVHLSKLTDLDIRYNKLQSIDILSQLPMLKVLYCSKNSVSAFSAEFPKLKLFFFDRNPLTKIEFVESHTTLTVLNLSKAKLAALDETFLEKIPLVEKLVLDKNHMSSLPPHIGSLKRLCHLSVVSNNLDTVPPEIGSLHELRHLDLHNNNIRSLPEEIWNLGCLEYLNASSNLMESFPKHSAQSSISSSDSEKFAAVGELAQNHEVGSNSGRRPSTLSISSSLALTEGRMPAHPSSSPVGRQSAQTSSRDLPNGLRPRRTLSQCLLTLSLSDNRLTDDCFEEISYLTELQTLNLSYNELVDIPYGALRRLSRLSELYLSGNNLTSLPADDIESIHSLRVLHVNSNKLHSLPAELGKINHLMALDVGCNNLKYNINNWPYDWNWNYNLELRYLNFSGNRRLEVKALPNHTSHFGRETNEKDLSDFTVLSNIRVLGLMDVTLITPSVPDQAENCRVRTYGSEINSMPFGMADSIGTVSTNLSVIDMVLERFRGMDNEVVIGLFDGRCEGASRGNKVSKLIQETFGAIFTEELKKLRDGETEKDALRRAFLNTNKEIGNTTMMPSDEMAHSSIAHRSSTAIHLEYRDGMTGSCATIVYIKQNKLFVANAGDSMAIISRASGEYTVLTTRHDPTSETELARVRAGAGVVSSNGLLDGILDVSRAIGFYNLIPHIHASPSITEYYLADNDEILILGSKQLWEYVSYQIALDVVRMSNGDLMRAAAKLRDFAISYGASDKIMVMVIGVGISRRRSKNRMVGTAFGPMTGVGEEELFPAFKKRRDRSLLPEDSRLARLGGEVDPPIGDLAMVFTDIKNSTLLWETAPIAMRSAIKVHNSIMRRQLRIIGGYEVKTEGDAFMVSFPTPTSALLWCFSVQSLLLVADWPAEIIDTTEGREILDDKEEVIFRGLSVRMGIHWGAPVCERDPITRRMDYFGPMVNRAARVSAVADGGQIALSLDFVSEMKRLHDAVGQFKAGDAPTLADAFGGDEALGLAIEHDMKMLDNLGWERKDLGEEKLKGLENPEFISLAYQNNLLGRYPIHTKRTLEKRSVPQPAVHSPSLSTTLVTVSQLEMDMLKQLRALSIRLEAVCTRLSSQASSIRLDSSRVSHLLGMSTLSVCSEADYSIFMNHLITRIENCLSTLYLRATVFKLQKRSAEISGGGSMTNQKPFLSDMNPTDLANILNSMLQLTGKKQVSSAVAAATAPAADEDVFEDAREYVETASRTDSSATIPDEQVGLASKKLSVTFSNQHEVYSAPGSPKAT